jgi:hypothetical protein
VAHGRTTAGPALRRPARLAHSKTESGLTQPSRLSAPTRRARPHRAGALGARGTAGLPRGRRRPRCTGKSTLSMSTSTCTRRAPTRRELVIRRGVRSGYGSPAARWFYGIQCLPCFRYRREMTGGVWHSRQWRGLDKGAGSEALTGDGRRSGQRSGEVAVPSSSW